MSSGGPSLAWNRNRWNGSRDGPRTSLRTIAFAASAASFAVQRTVSPASARAVMVPAAASAVDGRAEPASSHDSAVRCPPPVGASRSVISAASESAAQRSPSDSDSMPKPSPASRSTTAAPR